MAALHGVLAVPEEYYTHREDGSLITQSASAQGIGEMLARLDVHPGMRVLEIGTGSGFSDALLGALVGERGSVVSVDVMADLVERARKLHARRDADNVTVITGDGAKGPPLVGQHRVGPQRCWHAVGEGTGRGVDGRSRGA